MLSNFCIFNQNWHSINLYKSAKVHISKIFLLHAQSYLISVYFWNIPFTLKEAIQYSLAIMMSCPFADPKELSVPNWECLSQEPKSQTRPLAEVGTRLFSKGKPTDSNRVICSYLRSWRMGWGQNSVPLKEGWMTQLTAPVPTQAALGCTDWRLLSAIGLHQ